MSIMRCSKHDVQFDSDFHELCPRCANTEIKTTFVYPPIPLRQYDWEAHFDDDEPNDNGRMKVGFGRTETEAINDLIANYYD